MPIYSYRCGGCGNEVEEFRQLKDRERILHCICGGTYRPFLSFTPKVGPGYPFVDNFMDHQPVVIESLSHYRKELKKRGLQEKGVRRGHKGQWV